MLSLVHLIYMAGDKCMRQNACFLCTTIHNIVSEILVKNRKLFTLIIHGTEALLYTKKYIPLHISFYMAEISLALDNKTLTVERDIKTSR